MKINLETAWQEFQEMLFDESLDNFQRAKSKMITLRNLLERFSQIDEDKMIMEIDEDNLNNLISKLKGSYCFNKYRKEIKEILNHNQVKKN